MPLVVFLAAAVGLALAYWWAGGFSARGRAVDRSVRERRKAVTSRSGFHRRLGR